MIKDNKKKILIIVSIIILTATLFFLNDWKQVLTIIIVAFIGVLIPQLFDITQIILNKVNDLSNTLNPKRYEKTFTIYDERLTNFAANFYFFISEILIDEQKDWLMLARGKDFSLSSIAEAFSNLLKNGQPTFKRIQKDGKETFSDESCNRFNLAQGELCDIYRILKSLPQELEFTAKRYPDFINLQSAFYQVKNTFIYNSNSRACEAFVEAFLKDLSKFLVIK